MLFPEVVMLVKLRRQSWTVETHRDRLQLDLLVRVQFIADIVLVYGTSTECPTLPKPLPMMSFHLIDGLLIVASHTLRILTVVIERFSGLPRWILYHFRRWSIASAGLRFFHPCPPGNLNFDSVHLLLLHLSQGTILPLRNMTDCSPLISLKIFIDFPLLTECIREMPYIFKRIDKGWR